MKNTQSNNKSSKPEAESEAVDPGGGQLAVYDGGFKIDNYIPYRLAQTQLMVNRAISPDAHPDLLAIQRFTLREIRVLGMVGHHRSISPSGLAESTGLDRATVTRTLSVLTDKKMIVIMRNAQDGRSKFIGLTRLGATYCEVLFPIMKEYGEFLEEALEPEEKEALLKILKKLRIQAASRL